MKNILSIDGGGIKCYIPLRILDYIETKTNLSTSDLFEYFTSVSSGALIISALLLKNNNNKPKYTANELLTLIEELTNNIFTNTLEYKLNNGFGLLGSKYDVNNLDNALYNYFLDIKLVDLLKPVSVISFDIKQNKPYYFNITKNSNIYIRDILRATCSAPLYFDPYDIIINNTEYTFIDGGIASNNPIEYCFLEAYDYYNQEIKNDFYILSIGTGYSDTKYDKYDIIKNGLIYWSSNIYNIMYSESEDNLLKVINRLSPNNVSNRINVNMHQQISLDNVSSFPLLKEIMDKWIIENEEYLDNICKDLLINYINNKIN